MREIIYAAIFLLAAATAQAQQAGKDGDGVSLYDRCTAAASAADDLSNLKGAELTKATTCLSYLVAVHAALSHVHSFYKSTMLNYGNWTDETFHKEWVANQVLLAPDVCFPDQITPKTLALVLSGYGKQHLQDLTKLDRFDLAASAFVNAYPCQ